MRKKGNETSRTLKERKEHMEAVCRYVGHDVITAPIKLNHCQVPPCSPSEQEEATLAEFDFITFIIPRVRPAVLQCLQCLLLFCTHQADFWVPLAAVMT